MEIEQVIDHIQNRSYMSGVDRDRARIKARGEVFTPDYLANEILDSAIEHFTAEEQTNFIKSNWVDPAVGDGALLGAVIISKMKCGASFIDAIKSIKGYDIEQSNINEAINRLSCNNDEARQILKKNLICQNAGTILNNNYEKWFE